MRWQWWATAAVLAASTTAVVADEIGSIGTDWTGNDIKIEAVRDPEVQGVTCHLSYFDRGLIDRLWQGNWFNDPSNSSIACRQTAPIVVGKIDFSADGEEVYSQRQSLLIKYLAVRRIYDKENDTLVYVAYSRQVKEGSAKMAISTVPLYGLQVTWSVPKPE